jgi:IPT/TIG domain
MTMTVTNINPTSGTPGTPVTITGSGFGDPIVMFGAVEADVTGWQDTAVGCYVPNVGPGVYLVTVNEGDEESNSIEFTVLPVVVPSITGFFPDSGEPGTEVTISGSGFGSGNGSVFVSFNGSESDSVIVESDSEILATVPEDASSGDITVSTSSWEATSDFAFEVDQTGRRQCREPATNAEGIVMITGMYPAGGRGGSTATIYGRGWTIGDVAVTFGNLEAQLIRCDPVHIEVVVPNLSVTRPTIVEVALWCGGEVAAVTHFVYEYPSPPSVADGPCPEQNAVQAAVTAAWDALFVPGPSSLPASLAANSPVLAVPDIDGLKAAMQACDACWDPEDPYMRADGDAVVDLTAMWLQGLATLATSGAPVFAANGMAVSFPVNLGPLGVGGRWNVSQECANLGGDVETSQSGALQVVVAECAYWLNATVVVDPATQLPQVSVVSMVNAAPPAVQFTFSYENAMPQWLVYISGQWVIDSQLDTVVTGAFNSAFADSILPQITYLVNAEIAALMTGVR